MKKKISPRFNLLKLLLSIGVCEGVGIGSSFVTVSQISSWYLQLNKPSFNPPNQIFGPVWTVLYFLMGVSLYLVWNKKGNLKWFWIQLVLNGLWSFVFFGFHSPEIAFVVIIFLWLAIFMTIKSFWSQNKYASLIMLPYLFWVSFATILNFYIAKLN